jgi:hypothetical protein
MQVRQWVLAAAVSAAAACALTARAEITGKVKLDGQAPEPKQIDMGGVPECAKLHADPVFEETVFADENGNLANVVVSIKTDDPSALGGDVPKEPAVLDQKGCTYVPHVLAVMVGQEIVIKNSDPFLHNVHSLAQTNPAFNFGQPNVDPGKKVDPMKVAENIKVKCDVHPWMGMYLIVREHPFFAVSKEDGSFTIPGELPDGEYTLEAWHESLGTQEAKVNVSGGKAELAEPITFKASGASAEPVNKDVRLASLTQEKKADSSCSSGCCTEKSAGTKMADSGASEKPSQASAAAK